MRPWLVAWCLGVAVPAIALPVALVWATPACADSWSLPETTTYFAPCKQVRLTVVPRDLESQLDYFEDKVDGKPGAGQQRGGTGQPHATLERIGGDGKWTRIWARELVNDVAPVEALVDDRGAYVVTFDNWHSIGYGDDAIVIYDVAANSVRTFSVEKLFGADYFRALPRTVSSVHWRSDAWIENDSLIILAALPGEIPREPGSPGVELAINLSTGASTKRDAVAWTKARAAADAVNAAKLVAIAAERAARIAPLLAPVPSTESGWHSYLREAFWRLDPEWVEGYPVITVLRPRTAPNYRDSVGWVNEALREEIMDVAMFAATDEADLLNALDAATKKLRQGQLSGARIYVAASESARARLSAAFARSGATLILLDPTVPIVQRPERLPRADGSLPSPFDFRERQP